MTDLIRNHSRCDGFGLVGGADDMKVCVNNNRLPSLRLTTLQVVLTVQVCMGSDKGITRWACTALS